MISDPAVKMRINKRVFQQYFDVALRKHGSLRRVAKEVGVSHALVGQILNTRTKTHVNLDTADRFEVFFGAPSGVIFMPELLSVERNESARAA